MQATDEIPVALGEIATILREGRDYSTHAADIEDLRELALSDDIQAQARFRTEITQNKWYWLGMGTIADISFPDRGLNGRFIRAYYKLAIACNEAGFGSIHSQDVATIYGKWIRDGVV